MRMARETAVCATPPSLENGLVQDLPLSKLICGGEDNVPPPEGPLASLQSYSGTKISLRSYQFDGSRISLSWSVVAPVVSYYCNALVIYEDIGNHEVLLDSKPVRCNSSQLPDAKSLTLSLSANELQTKHSYRSVNNSVVPITLPPEARWPYTTARASITVRSDVPGESRGERLTRWRIIVIIIGYLRFEQMSCTNRETDSLYVP